MLPSRKRAMKVLIRISIFSVFIIFIFYKIDNDIKPVLFSVANSEVKIVATECINKTVKEELSKNIMYNDFVSVKTDKNGDISAIELNTIQMNKFGSTVALKVLDEIKFVGGRGIGIPVGVITGSSLLSYYGPKMNIKVMPIGSIITDFKSELQSAGINQTRYRVYITVSTSLHLLIPFGKEKIDVISTIPIAETLIVGKVPASYFNIAPGGVNIPNIVPIPTPEMK